MPGSKSITNRALVLAALADGTSTLTGVLHSDDTRHMRRGLNALGIDQEDLDDTTVRVHGGPAHLHPPKDPVYVGNSGTTVRFLAALAALVPGAVRFEGDTHMQRRPISDLVQGLEQLGIVVDCPTGCPPLTVYGGGLGAGCARMRGDRSSQYFSALLMAGALAAGPVQLDIEGSLVSRPYVEVTRAMVRAFGGRIDETEQGFRIQPISAYRARDFAVEPDASSASYAFGAAAATGGRVTVPGLAEGALQGDYGFVRLLERMGAQVSRNACQTTVEGPKRLRGVDADMHHISDTVMTLAALAPLAEGPTTIVNVANIRIKETDRLEASVTELRRLGQLVQAGQDWLRIDPRPVRPATVECYSDHRIAMSFAILGLACPGVTIADPACVAKTYPGFWQDLDRLRHASEG